MKIDLQRTVLLGIFMLLLVVAALQIRNLQTPHVAVATASPTSSSVESPVAELFGPKTHAVWELVRAHKTEVTGVVNIFFAMIIGLAGAFAFYVGVHFGFISPESRAEIKKYIIDGRNVALFTLLGGVVAGVFQWAQAATLAPIQAFVLGATWPSVVTRIMSGSSAPPPPPTPTQVVGSVPAGAAASGQPSKAEVIIPPPATSS